MWILWKTRFQKGEFWILQTLKAGREGLKPRWGKWGQGCSWTVPGWDSFQQDQLSKTMGQFSMRSVLSTLEKRDKQFRNRTIPSKSISVPWRARSNSIWSIVSFQKASTCLQKDWLLEALHQNSNINKMGYFQHTGAKPTFLSRNSFDFDVWKIWILWKLISEMWIL